MDKSIDTLPDIPYTISFIIRKRQQIDGLNELPKEKRPPERLIWEGTSEDIDNWLDRVFDSKSTQTDTGLMIYDEEIEK